MGKVVGPCPVLVEREPELRALSGTAAEASMKGARLVLVTGEAGAGKTRLWTEFIDTLPEGWRVEYVGGHQSDRSWSAPFEALIGTLADDDDPERALGNALADACIARAEGSPLALIIEDLHFLDPVAVTALPCLLDRMRSAPLLVIATYRLGSHPVGSAHSRAVAQLLREATAFELRLGPLSETGVQTMVDALGAEVDAAAMHERTRGNPFFVEELARAPEQDVPWTVSEAVLNRMATLTAPAVHLAEVLAVAAGPLPGRVLDHVDVEWTSAFRVLTDAALAIEEGDDAVLRHALVADALAGRMSKAERRHRHAEIAKAVEVAAPERVELLARHWEGAGDTARAAPAAAIAADRSGARGGHRTATELYQVALQHPPPNAADAAALLERASVSAALAADGALARSWAAAARIATEESGPRWKASGRWANPVFQRVVQQGAGFDNERADALSAQIIDAQELVRSGDYAGAARTAQRLLSAASALGDHALESEAALIIWYAGDLDGARVELERIAAEAQAEGDPVAATNALGRLGRLDWASGYLSAAAARAVTTVTLARSNGEPMVWGTMQMGHAFYEGLCGDVEKSQALCDELLASDHSLVTLMGRAAAALPALERVDPAEARAHLDAVLPAVRTLEVDYFTLPVLINDARWYFQQGDDLTASERLDEAQPLLWSPVQEHMVDFWCLRGRVTRRLGRRDDVVEAAREMADLALHATGPAVLAAAEEMAAALSAVDGHLDDALARYERAARGWETAPRWGFAADAWCEAAAVAQLAAPMRVTELLDHALAVSARHGLARCRRRAEALRSTEASPSPSRDPGLARLTPRELEISRLVAEGRTNREIGVALYLSEKTVRNVLSPVFAKLGISRRSELAALFVRAEVQG